MRQVFDEYYVPDAAEFEKLWNSCTFVLDASVLLSLYRYSTETRDTFLSLLEKLSGETRLWVPYQAGKEYQENRRAVIRQQGEAYGQLKKALVDAKNAWCAQVRRYKRHPLIEATRYESLFDEAVEGLVRELDQAHERHPNFLQNDPILSRLTSILDGKIGEPFDERQERDLEADAKRRYALEVPPGYRDADKQKGSPYGDYFIWRQVLDYAAKVKAPVVLVTDDAKDDWWLIDNGQTIGPRPELRREFRQLADQGFYMYHGDQFLAYAANLWRDTELDSAADEARSVRQEDAAKALALAWERAQAMQKHRTDLVSRLNTLRAQIGLMEAQRHAVPPFIPPEVAENNLVALRSDAEAVVLELQQLESFTEPGASGPVAMTQVWLNGVRIEFGSAFIEPTVEGGTWIVMMGDVANVEALTGVFGTIVTVDGLSTDGRALHSFGIALGQPDRRVVVHGSSNIQWTQPG